MSGVENGLGTLFDIPVVVEPGKVFFRCITVQNGMECS